MIKKFIKRIARSFGKFLKKVGSDLEQFGQETPEPIKKVIQDDFFNVEMYITIVISGEDGSQDAGYILLNVREQDISEASDLLRKMPIWKIKSLLGLAENQIIKDVHHGISESRQNWYFKDINGLITKVNNFNALKGGL